MSHILHTSTVHKTASLADEGNSAYCQSSGAHATLNKYKPMEISTERSPQHWWPSEGSSISTKNGKSSFEQVLFPQLQFGLTTPGILPHFIIILSFSHPHSYLNHLILNIFANSQPTQFYWATPISLWIWGYSPKGILDGRLIIGLRRQKPNMKTVHTTKKALY